MNTDSKLVTTRNRALVGLFAVSLIGAGITLTASSALADNKTYSGSTCVANSDDIHHAQSKSENESTTNVRGVFCPVVRDNMWTGLNPSKVQVIDQNFDNAVKCTLSSRDKDGSQYDYDTEQSSGTSPSVQELTFSALSSLINGHYTLYCTIPPVFSGERSAVVSYFISEA
ncbi:MAG: hypothetical protein AAGC55_09315 [Myxococcota bacterium]